MTEPKTVFLTPASIHAAYHKCIREAKQRAVMVVPWFTPSGQLKDALYGMLARDVAFTLVTRPPSEAKEHWHDVALSDLLSRQRVFDGKRGFLGFGKQEAREQIEVVLVRSVHAKMVAQDEDCVIISSSNLNWSSVAENTEFGVLCREKSVVIDALAAVDEVRRSVRSSSTTNGGIRNCTCGGWVLELGHEVCRSCYLKSKNGREESTEVPAETGGEQTEGAADPKVEAKAKPVDPFRCPKCGSKKLRDTDRVCKKCYFAEKGGSPS